MRAKQSSRRGLAYLAYHQLVPQWLDKSRLTAPTFGDVPDTPGFIARFNYFLVNYLVSCCCGTDRLGEVARIRGPLSSGERGLQVKMCWWRSFCRGLASAVR